MMTWACDIIDDLPIGISIHLPSYTVTYSIIHIMKRCAMHSASDIMSAFFTEVMFDFRDI